MNKQRRKELSDIYSEMEAILARLESVRDEEQDAFDSMPVSLQASERGEQSENAISEMESAIGDIESAMGSIENAQE
jgi:tetrahydromethanopterin S-methyltransferase subunit A